MKRDLAHVVQTLNRAGLHELAAEAGRQLEDPVDQRDLEAFLRPYGITRDTIVDLMGGNP